LRSKPFVLLAQLSILLRSVGLAQRCTKYLQCMIAGCHQHDSYD
jgi:hypothetical protein